PVPIAERRSRGNHVSRIEATTRRWSNSSASPSRRDFRRSWKSGPPKTKERSGTSWRTFGPSRYTSGRRDSLASPTLVENMLILRTHRAHRKQQQNRINTHSLPWTHKGPHRLSITIRPYNG